MRSHSRWRRLSPLLPRRRRGWIWVVFTAATVLNALRLRRRLEHLARLSLVDPGTGGAGAGADDFVVYHLPSVAVPPAVRAAAVAFAEAEGLDVVDLVPAGLSPDDTLDLVRAVDPAEYRSAALAPGRGAGQAVVVRSSVAERAGALAPADSAEFVALTKALKKHAARGTDLAVVPAAPDNRPPAGGLAVVKPSRDQRIAALEAQYTGAYAIALAIPAARSSLLLAGLALSPGWGVAALAAYQLQPRLAIPVPPFEQPDVTPGRTLRRLLEPFALMATAAGAGGDRPAPEAEDPIESRRPAYAAELAQGVDRFFEPRRADCPWCHSQAIVPRLDTPDFVQFKPGRFQIDECKACGFLFQNPRLSLLGLDFYYRDAYDGLAGEKIESLFALAKDSYQGRVALASRHGSPRSWLDVGSGYGHFCLFARGLLPDTHFDGLDMGMSIEVSQRRGWVDTGYRGLFPDKVDELKGRYDLVSMHHYLEHTLDPVKEIRAAHDVLEPGGLLLIEVPDPASRSARVFGRYWLPWLQPQHLQFLSVSHMTAALQAEGFEVVEVERGAAHQPNDLGGAVWQFATALAGPARSPWLDPPTTVQQVRRPAILAALGPVALAGLLGDQLLLPVVRAKGEGWSNTYRVLARRT